MLKFDYDGLGAIVTLTAEELYEFHAAGRDGNVNMIRRYLHKINDFIEDIKP